MCTPGSWSGCMPPTWRSSRTSTAASTARATPARRSPARTARAASRSTSRVGAWGNRDVRPSPAPGGDRVHRLSLPLATRGDPRPDPRRTPAVGGRDRPHQHPRERRRLSTWHGGTGRAPRPPGRLPTAPTGLVHGVTRAAAPQPAHTGGGPLLLRALRPEGADGPRDGTPDAGA